MTNERVEVIQADRDAAAEIFRLYGAENYAAICEKGRDICDGLAAVQAFARHRLRHTPAPAADAVEAVARAIIDHLKIRVSSTYPAGATIGPSLHEAVPAARAAISAYERCSGVERLREALEFYRDEWEQDVDAERTAHGWTGRLGEIEPTSRLLDDRGEIARSALSSLKEQQS